MPLEMDAKPRSWLALLLVVILTAPVSRAARASEPTKCASSYEGAQLLRQRGKLVDAREAARTCAQEGCPEIARKDCASWIEQLDREIPSVAVAARDERDQEVGGARIFIDSMPRADAGSGRPIDLDPGTHAIRVEANGYDAVEQSSTIVQGERGRILRITLRKRVAVAPPPPLTAEPKPAESAPSLVPAFVVGAFSVAALGMSAYFGVTGRDDLARLRSSCAPACSDDEVEPVKRELRVSDVALGVGLVGVAITTYLVIHAVSGRHPTQSSRMPYAIVF